LKITIYSGFTHEKWWIFPVRYVSLPEGIGGSIFHQISSVYLLPPAQASKMLDSMPDAVAGQDTQQWDTQSDARCQNTKHR